MRKKIGIVVQRYGLEINGGAEYHARLIAEHLSSHFDIEVFTSSSFDYITWTHHYPDPCEEINGIPVNRFQVSKPRDPESFGKIQEIVFGREHAFTDELKWLEEEGPYLPDLLRELERREKEFDSFIFFSYRYYHSYHGILRFPKKSILVPTAEEDQVIHLRLFKDFFHHPAAIVYNSIEERAMIQRVSCNHKIPGDVVGVGSEIPETFHPEETKQKYHLPESYCLYIGRLDENKGVPQLFRYFIRFLDETAEPAHLVLVGRAWVPVPDHPQIHHLGFLSNQEKFDLLKGARFLLIPSQYESLSMALLEAFALEKPALVNGRTPVLRGQCQRSQAGLWYRNYDEFRETMKVLFENNALINDMGNRGREYFNTHYDWKIIVNKYLKILQSC